MSDVEALANIASGAWHVIESNKPSHSLASNTCNAVPAGVSDPVNGLTGAQGPNSVTWALRSENAFSVDVVDIAFDLRWEFGARYHGGGAFIPNCYLYVPRCSVLWGFEVDVQLHVHNPTNAGTESAPIARLPLTITGTVNSLIKSESVQWDFALFGNGEYHYS
ncbi:MAG: hypothetical protein QOH97_4117 [Actinoplanes sp.]|jgi:hypothetical protein|nr:hypothetical protein [Actinoplanes sp.]